MFPLVRALRCTHSAAGFPALFAGLDATTAESDFSRPFIIGFGSSPSRRGQGYLFGRPMVLSSLRRWLGERVHGVSVSRAGYGTLNDFGDSAP